MRFICNYAFENILTKDLNQHILDDVVAPEFRKDHYSEGIKKGVEAIVKILDEQLHAMKNDRFY